MSKLFQKAKLAVKFRRAGEGHVLNAASTPSTSNQPRAPQEPRKAPSSDAQRAGLVRKIFNSYSCRAIIWTVWFVYIQIL